MLFLIIWATILQNISVNYAKTGCATLTRGANTIKPFTAKFTHKILFLKIWTVIVPKISVNYEEMAICH